MKYRYGCRCDSYRLPHIPVTAPSFKEIVVEGDNKVTEKMVKSNIPMPSVETTDLENILKAGIPLQRTNTKVIESEFGEFLNFVNSDEGELLEETPAETEIQTQTQTNEE